MMSRHRLIIAAAALAAPLPAAASDLVLGSDDARTCFLAADAGQRPRAEDMRRCDTAIFTEYDRPGRLAATYVNRGVLRLRLNDLAGAAADFDAAIRTNPDEAEAYLNRASLLLRQDKAGDAIAQFELALAKKTRRPALAYFGRATANELAGNVGAAYRDYVRASELAPNWIPPRLELARFTVVRD